MSAPKRRHLVFGLDAAEWTLVRRWADEGHLPTFRRLFDSGTFGTLSTTAQVLPDTVWSCIYSGRNPATFDKYFYVQYDPSTGDLRHVKDSGFTKEPFWKLMSDAGQRVGVVDAVKFPVTEGLNGFMIANWGAHATKAPKASIPPQLFDEAARKFGRNPVGDVDRISDTAASRRDMRDRLLRGAAMRSDLLAWLAKEQEWDLMFCGFSECHQVGHHFWHAHETTHPKHAEAVEQGIADAMLQVYSAVDATMDAAWDAAGSEDLTVMALAGHGMGTLRHASWNVGEMLDLLGYGPRPARQTEGGEKVAETGFWRMLKKTVPGWLQYGIKERLPQRLQDELLFRWYAGKRDWKGWRAFAIPNNDTVGAIRINVKGRDAHGIVDPADYDRTIDELIEAFEELTDPTTGRKVVLQINPLHRQFSGEYLNQLPDLCILWDQSFGWDAVHSPRFGTLRIRMQDSRTGSHTPQGFFVAAGPDIPAGRELHNHSIFDIAPTLLERSGVAVPEGLDGQPIPLAGASKPINA